MTAPMHWTLETAHLVLREVRRHWSDVVNGVVVCNCDWFISEMGIGSIAAGNAHARHQAEAILQVLADAGLLLPPGGKNYIEYGYVRRDVGSSYGSHDPVDAAQAFARAGGLAVARRGIRVAIEWPETGGLFYGPWQFDDE